MILAIDPGTSKIGWAVVDNSGKSAIQGIAPIEFWDNRLMEAADLGQIRVAVVGDGTNRVNIERVLERLVPQVEVVVIDEKNSTVDAWKLKREEEAGNNPLRMLLFALRQMFKPVPVDDYAARVLAIRYLERLSE